LGKIPENSCGKVLMSWTTFVIAISSNSKWNLNLKPDNQTTAEIELDLFKILRGSGNP
jgi:hypothetical protein